jgi:hypothetical protein
MDLSKPKEMSTRELRDYLISLSLLDVQPPNLLDILHEIGSRMTNLMEQIDDA